MSRQIWKAGPLLLFLVIGMNAADENERQNLIGSWVTQDEAGANWGWTIETKNDGFQITEIKGASNLATYSCKADGHECEVKIGGKKTTVSMWFNGPKLVQLETQGTSVVKRRFAALPEGAGMEVEIIPVVPGGKVETVRFNRVQASAKQE